MESTAEQVGESTVRTRRPVRAEPLTSASAGFLIGTVPVAYLLATGRWGSHLTIPGLPIYITDVLLLASFAALVRRREWDLRKLITLTPILLLVAWATAVFALNSEWTRTGLRDYAPYLYGAIAVTAIDRGDVARARRTFWALWGALVFHLCWVLPVVAGPRSYVDAHKSGTGLFDVRSDFDASCIAVLFGLSTLLAVKSDRLLARWGHLALAGVCVFAVARLGTRAGSLVLIATLVLASVALWRTRPARSRRFRAGSTAVAAISVLLALVLVPSTSSSWSRSLEGSAAARLGSTIFGVSSARSSERASSGEASTTPPPPTTTTVGRGSGERRVSPPAGAGTARARLLVWQEVWDHVAADPVALVSGVGFGPDFLAESGAEPMLGGQRYEGVRAPHNYFVNTLARLGLVGLVLLGAVVIQWLWSAARLLWWDPSELPVLTVLVSSGILAAATFGVVLESPFGAIPFFWAVGWITTEAPRRGVRGADALGSISMSASR